MPNIICSEDNGYAYVEVYSEEGNMKTVLSVCSCSIAVVWKTKAACQLFIVGWVKKCLHQFWVSWVGLLVEYGTAYVVLEEADGCQLTNHLSELQRGFLERSGVVILQLVLCTNGQLLLNIPSFWNSATVVPSLEPSTSINLDVQLKIDLSFSFFTLQYSVCPWPLST